MFNNAYQNLELKIDLASGGTIAGLKEKIKSILGNKILILCGLLLSGVPKLPAVCEPKIYVTQTEEPDDWDEEEDGEFVPEDVYHLEASNIYGYDIAIEDNVVTCTATQSATYAGVETLIEGGTLDNAKPIYCHPVNIGYKDDDHEFMVTMLIFNNSETAFTFESFNQWIANLVQEITNVRILTSGYVIISGTTYPASLLFANATARQLIVSPAGVSSILDSFSIAEWEALTPSYFNDGVNKIN